MLIDIENPFESDLKGYRRLWEQVSPALASRNTRMLVMAILASVLLLPPLVGLISDAFFSGVTGEIVLQVVFFGWFASMVAVAVNRLSWAYRERKAWRKIAFKLGGEDREYLARYLRDLRIEFSYLPQPVVERVVKPYRQVWDDYALALLGDRPKERDKAIAYIFGPDKAGCSGSGSLMVDLQNLERQLAGELKGLVAKQEREREDRRLRERLASL